MRLTPREVERLLLFQAADVLGGVGALVPHIEVEALFPDGSRMRAAVEDCRELTAASMLRHGRTGEVRVDPRTLAVTLEGEALAAPPLEEVALPGRYLMG